jgi:fucose permease
MIAVVTLPRSLTLAGFGAFLLIGALQAYYGVAQFGLRTAFNVNAVSVGAFSSLLFVGAVTGILVFPWAQARFGTKLSLGTASALLLLGSSTVALAGSWPLTLAAVTVVGLGYGGVVIGFNVLFSQGFAARGAMMVNLLNASFGVGSVIGPLIVGALGNYRAAYLLSAALAAIVLALTLGARLPTLETSPSSARLEPGAFTSTLWIFLAMFFAYVVVETGAAGSQARYLRETLGVEPGAAAVWNALFWGGLTAGRILIAPLALRVPSANIVLGSSVLLFVALALTHVPAVAGVAYTVAGLACGPVFPTGLVWFTRHTGGNSALASLMVAAASLGGVVSPFAVSALTGGAAGATPTAVTLLGGTLLLLTLAGFVLSKGGSGVKDQF